MRLGLDRTHTHMGHTRCEEPRQLESIDGQRIFGQSSYCSVIPNWKARYGIWELSWTMLLR